MSTPAKVTIRWTDSRFGKPAPVKKETPRTEKRKAEEVKPAAPTSAPVNNYGPPLWTLLHFRALKVGNDRPDLNFLNDFATELPCGACRNHWFEMMERTPPTWNKYFSWTVDRHNEVNSRLGKRVVPFEEAFDIWTLQKNKEKDLTFNAKLLEKPTD